MTKAHALARRGEDLAVRYLQRRGWRILARNVRTPYGELDIVARDGPVWVFVEVKARSGLAFGWPEEAVTPRKMQRIVASALYWLATHEVPPDVDWRIDVIAILFPKHGHPQLRHFEGVGG